MHINRYDSPLAYLTASDFSSVQCMLNNSFGNGFPRVTFLIKNPKTAIFKQKLKLKQDPKTFCNLPPPQPHL